MKKSCPYWKPNLFDVEGDCVCQKSQPDPLALLEKWMRFMLETTEFSPADLWCKMRRFILQLRENPEAVAEMGRKEGWYP